MRTAVIPARGGSRRIPRKNLKAFHGRPIIAYPIAACQLSKMFDRIVVSTDDDEIAAVAKLYGAEVLIRPAELARDEVGTQAVMAHALREVGSGRHACCVYATAPLLTRQDLWRCWRLLVRSQGDYAYTPGIMYWGRTTAFLADAPLGNVIYNMGGREVDINTMDDWMRAESMA